MIIVMRRDATEKQIQAVIDKLISEDFDVHRSTGVERTVLGVIGSGRKDPGEFLNMPGVSDAILLRRD